MHRKLTLLVAGLAIAGSMFLIGPVGLDFFPSVDAGILRMHVRAPTGTRIEETERIVDAIERRSESIIPQDELLTIDDNIGIPLYYNLGFVQTDNVDGADAEVFVALAPEHRPSLEYVRRIRHDVESDFPAPRFFSAGRYRQSRAQLRAGGSHRRAGRRSRHQQDLAYRAEARARAPPDSGLARRAHRAGRQPPCDPHQRRPQASRRLGMSQRDVANSLLTTLSSSSLTAPISG